MKKQKITRIAICSVIIVATLGIALATNKRHEKSKNNADSEAANQTEQTGSISSGKTNATPFPQNDRGEEHYANAQRYISNGDTENAIRELRSIPSSSKYYSDAQATIVPLEDAYRASVLEKARNGYDSDGWSAACRVLRDGSDLLPGDYEILSAIVMYEACEPISFLQLEHRSESGGICASSEIYYRDGEVRDANGRYHSSAYGYIDFWIHCMGSGQAHVTKYSFGEFERFRAEYLVPKECDGSVIFKVYGDERELFNSGKVTRKEQGNFDVDITGFMEIKVVVQVVDWGIENTVNAYLFNAEVYNLPT